MVEVGDKKRSESFRLVTKEEGLLFVKGVRAEHNEVYVVEDGVVFGPGHVKCNQFLPLNDPFTYDKCSKMLVRKVHDVKVIHKDPLQYFRASSKYDGLAFVKSGNSHQWGLYVVEGGIVEGPGYGSKFVPWDDPFAHKHCGQMLVRGDVSFYQVQSMWELWDPVTNGCCDSYFSSWIPHEVMIQVLEVVEYSY